MTAVNRIVLLHATPVAIEPIQAAFKTGWPEAETVNLLDDSLSEDRRRSSDLTPEMIGRFVELGRYGHHIGAAGILVTCSAFGPAIEKLAETLPIPVLKPNEAMFEAAFGYGRRIAMLATFEPAIASMRQEFETFAAEKAIDARLDTFFIEDALQALQTGDAARHNTLVAERAAECGGYDAVMLAQFSTSRASDAVGAVIGVPVLTAPGAAVARMRQLVEG